jgi:hypothetical protein
MNPPTVRALIADALSARERFIATVGTPSHAQAVFKPSPDVWSIVDNVEHMTLAERSGTNGMWKALDGVRRGAPVWEGEPRHSGRTIESVVEATWKPREIVPPIAAPSWGGPLTYWITALRAGHAVLEALGHELEIMEGQGVHLEQIIYPHPISGPLDMRQRLEFLRFHLDRHADQVRTLRAHADFPAQ